MLDAILFFQIFSVFNEIYEYVMLPFNLAFSRHHFLLSIYIFFCIILWEYGYFVHKINMLYLS